MEWAAIITLGCVSLYALVEVRRSRRTARLALATADNARDDLDDFVLWFVEAHDLTPEDYPITIDLVDADVSPLTEN